MLRAGWRKLRIAPRGAAVPFEVVKPLSLGLARVRYRWGERAHTGVIELGPRLVHRDDTALLIDPDNPRRCCGARVHEFARELDVVAAERRLRGLVERWLDISLDDPPADDEAPSDDPAIRARALIAWIDATLAADANLARSFEQWITAPQRRLELEHDDALALEQLVAFRRVRRHVRHRFVIGTAGFTALAMGVAQALIFDGPFALMVGISFVLLTLVLWALMPR